MKKIIVILAIIILLIVSVLNFQEKEIDFSWLPIKIIIPSDWVVIEDTADSVHSAVLTSKDSENIVRIQRYDGEKVFTPDNFNNRNIEERGLYFIDLIYKDQKSCWETNIQDRDISDNKCIEPFSSKNDYSLFKFQEGKQFVLVLGEDSFIHFSIEGDEEYLESILDIQ
jgi:hypothetical protein